jgi:hypothetical protein
MGLFTCYLAVTGWMAVRRRAGTTGAFERIACAFAFLMAAGMILLGVAAKTDPDGVFGGSPASGFFGIGTIVALAAFLDLKVVLNRGISGTDRIARHVWRMGLALWIAIGSFFLGQQRVMPESVQGSPLLLVPPLAIFAIVLFWLVWLRIGKRVRAGVRALRERTRAPGPAAAGS